MTDETKKLVLQMSVGTLLWNLILAAAGFFLAPVLGWTRSSVLLGLGLGFVCAEGMLVHMAVITERVLESGNPGYANKTTVMHSMIRKLAYIVLLVLVLWKLPQINALAVVLGTMGLKAGAYLQPVLFRADKTKTSGQ
ncbi:MAG: hypothetical protein Q4F29_13160 [Lachnospiraceae bacterium]|nr:hypothetical protein [Lachnospiraceae bacterium]